MVKVLRRTETGETPEQGLEPAIRVDLRFGTGPDGRILLMNKRDRIIREIVHREMVR